MYNVILENCFEHSFEPLTVYSLKVSRLMFFAKVSWTMEGGIFAVFAVIKLYTYWLLLYENMCLDQDTITSIEISNTTSISEADFIKHGLTFVPIFEVEILEESFPIWK